MALNWIKWFLDSSVSIRLTFALPVSDTARTEVKGWIKDVQIWKDKLLFFLFAFKFVMLYRPGWKQTCCEETFNCMKDVVHANQGHKMMVQLWIRTFSSLQHVFWSVLGLNAAAVVVNNAEPLVLSHTLLSPWFLQRDTAEWNSRFSLHVIVCVQVRSCCSFTFGSLSGSCCWATGNGSVQPGQPRHQPTLTGPSSPRGLQETSWAWGKHCRFHSCFRGKKSFLLSF